MISLDLARERVDVVLYIERNEVYGISITAQV